jgi:hypothetical protein
VLVTGFSAPPRTAASSVVATSRRHPRQRGPAEDRVAGSYHAEAHPASLTGIFLAISADLGHGTSRLNG